VSLLILLGVLGGEILIQGEISTLVFLAAGIAYAVGTVLKGTVLKMKTKLMSLLTHERLIIRFITAWLIGTVILFAAWFTSYTWLPDKFFQFLPGMAISPVGCEI
jgi:hypothetical protein